VAGRGIGENGAIRRKAARQGAGQTADA
jgi:hypothetical protein